MQQEDFDFYALYMFFLLLDKDLNEAKYLWKRAPDRVKSPPLSQLAAVWDVGRALWKAEISLALELLGAKTWRTGLLQRAAQLLRAQVIGDHVTLLGHSIHDLHLAFVINRLQITETEVLEAIRDLGWSLYPSGKVSITKKQTTKDSNLNIALASDMEELRYLSKFVAFNEQKLLKVDLSAKPTSNGPEVK